MRNIGRAARCTAARAAYPDNNESYLVDLLADAVLCC
jgi:hypothetical protein